MTRLNKMAAAPEIRKENKVMEREWRKPINYLPIALVTIAAVTIIAIITYKRKHK